LIYLLHVKYPWKIGTIPEASKSITKVGCRKQAIPLMFAGLTDIGSVM
jgi:hypothetical protein